MNIWMVAREYAGIAEAGGVKNVVCSLSEELAKLSNQVTMFLPLYGCTDRSLLENFSQIPDLHADINICGTTQKVSFYQAQSNGVNFIFADHNCFSEKSDIYVYNSKDLERFPDASLGQGYKDALFMNTLFEQAVCQYGKITGIAPDIIHCHDACTAALPAFAKTQYDDFYKDTKIVVSIHNAGPAYHHEFPSPQSAAEHTGLGMDIIMENLNGYRCEPYLLASRYSTLTTVSVDYAKELLDPENPNTDGLSELFHRNGTKIIGITNGIDTARYNPAITEISGLPYSYDPRSADLNGKYKCRTLFLKNYADKNTPDEYKKYIPDGSIVRHGYLDFDLDNPDRNVYISFHGRLVHQKGIPVIAQSMDDICPKYPDAKFIINGQGNADLQELMIEKAKKYPGQVIYFKGYDKAFSRLCTACGDFSLYPSDFEPCGLEDFIAQIYGTIPVAHATGGLNKIIDRKTGFTYKPNTPKNLTDVLAFLIEQKRENSDAFRYMIQFAANFVEENYTWKNVAKFQYMPLYKSL